MLGYIFPTLRQHGVLPQGKKITFFSFRIEDRGQRSTKGKQLEPVGVHRYGRV